MECWASHIKEIHSRGWEKDDPVKLNANLIEQLQMKMARPISPFRCRIFTIVGLGPQTSLSTYSIECSADKEEFQI